LSCTFNRSAVLFMRTVWVVWVGFGFGLGFVVCVVWRWCGFVLGSVG